MMNTEPKDLPKHVLIRDLVILQLKLWLDGLKDIALSPLSIGAGILDILRGPTADGHRLYKVLHWGERFDLWLNLYDATGRAESSGEGLFGGSRAGDETLIGRLERMAKGYDEEEEE
ncbi:MAG: hypothetical protein R6U63_02105 [Longimicrobiales bacterium]